MNDYLGFITNMRKQEGEKKGKGTMHIKFTCSIQQILTQYTRRTNQVLVLQRTRVWLPISTLPITLASRDPMPLAFTGTCIHSAMYLPAMYLHTHTQTYRHTGLYMSCELLIIGIKNYSIVTLTSYL